MNTINNSIETVNAAATAIISAESRVQPTSVQKKRWGSCLSLYWCFGSYKPSKRIGHALFLPDSTPSRPSAPMAETLNQSSIIVFPFIAPPSSPASFLQSDPPSATQSPVGFLSLKSLPISLHSQGVTGSLFTIGPYAYEPQLVSPPVFSAFTTEPSTASFTPPPEPVQLTTPSSPEVPFAELLTSSLARARRNSGLNQKFSLSQYEFLPYQTYPGSPGGNLISPGSIPNSGTSSPFLDKHPIMELRVGEAPKVLGYEHFTPRKWGSRLGSGSATPSGLGSTLGSGSLTPNGRGTATGSGSLTPNSRSCALDSGLLTPNGEELALQDNYLLESHISEVASLANSENGSVNEEMLIGHRVSFELTSEDVAICLDRNLNSSPGALSQSLRDSTAESSFENNINLKQSESCHQCCGSAISCQITEGEMVEILGRLCHCKRRSPTLGSSKEFNFDNANGEDSPNPSMGCEWWTGEKVISKDLGSQNEWTFFPVLQPRVS